MLSRNLSNFHIMLFSKVLCGITYFHENSRKNRQVNRDTYRKRSLQCRSHRGVIMTEIAQAEPLSPDPDNAGVGIEPIKRHTAQPPRWQPFYGRQYAPCLSCSFVIVCVFTQLCG